MQSRHLKILLVVGEGASAAGGQIWLNNIYPSLKALGHSVHLVRFAKHFASINSDDLHTKKKLLEKHILEEFYANQPFDYLLGFLSDQHVTPQFYDELKNKVFTINWSCNSHQFESLHKKNSPHIDLNTYVTKKHKLLYDSVGANSYWSPMAASDKIYKPSSHQDINLSFVGTAYGNRPYYIWRLLQSGIELELFGSGWKFEMHTDNILRLYIAPVIYNFLGKKRRLDYLDKTRRVNLLQQISELVDVGGIPNDMEYVQIMSRSRVSLNFPESRTNNDYLNPEVTFGCNFRDFEIPLSRSMLLTQDSEALDYFYDRNSEVVAFGNESDMIDKARYYSSNPAKAKKIAVAGYKRAKENHTWERRFKALFKYLES